MKTTSNTSVQTSEARISQSNIGSVYNGIAPIYNIWGTLTESKARARAIELAGITDGITILEVAVGTGLAFSEIVKKNPHGKNTGIDLSEGMLAKARSRLKKTGGANYTLKQGSALKLDVESKSVDILFNNYMFDLLSIENIDNALAEFKRVLKDDGRLILINMTRGEKIGSGIYDRIYRVMPSLMGGCRGVVLAEMLNNKGFSVHSREYIQQMFFPSEVILAYRPQG